VRSSLSDAGWGTIDLIRAASPHCGQEAHVAVIDGQIATLSIIPIFPIIAFTGSLRRTVDAGIVDAVAGPSK
jgi:hypothetical protein